MAVTLVNDLPPRSQFTANGTQTRFPSDWAVRDTGDVAVEFNEGQAPNIGFTFDPSGLNTNAGFDVVFNSPPPAGTLITVYRSGPLERQADYGQQKEFRAPVVNAEFADVIMRLQELRSLLNRTVRLPNSDPDGNMVLPGRAARALRVFGFDADGNPIPVAVSGDGLTGGIEIYDGAALVSALATRLIAGSNLTATLTTTGHVRMDAADAPPSAETVNAIDWGSDFDLPQDNTINIAPALNAIMAEREAQGIHITRYRPRPGEPDPLITSAVKVPSGHTFDRSAARFQRGRLGRIGCLGRLIELPETGKYRLAAPITAGATTIFLRVPDGGSLTALQNADAAGMDLIIRGENDASGEVPADRRETVPFSIIDDTDDQNIEVELATPAVNSYQIVYDNPDWEPAGPVSDFTLISVTVGALFAEEAKRGDHSVLLTSIPAGLVKGSPVMLRSSELVPSGTSTLPFGEEPHRVRDIVGMRVYLEKEVSRQFPMAFAPKLVLVDACRGARIICGHQPDVVVEAPLAAPAARIDHYVTDYAWDCEIVDPWVDDRHTTHNFRGAAVMVRRSYCCAVRRGRFFRRDNNGPGDRNVMGSFYSGCARFEDCFSVGGRHGAIAQGGYLPTWSGGHIVGANINALDTHGCGCRGATFENIHCVASTATSTDSSQQVGATVGNTSHRAHDVGTVIRGCTFTRYTAGAGAAGIVVRPPARETVVIGCFFDRNDTSIAARIDDRAGDLFIVGLTLRANVFADPGGDSLFVAHVDTSQNEAPAWETGQSITATAARPRHRTNVGQLYAAYSNFTTGATPPTQLTGTQSDGGGNWTWVAESANRLVDVINGDEIFEADGGGSGAGIPAGTSVLAGRDDSGAAVPIAPAADGTLAIETDLGVTTARAIARLGTAEYDDSQITASRSLTGSDRALVTVTPEGEASRERHQRLVARHGSNLATVIVLTIPQTLPSGPYSIYRPGDQEGAVALELGGAGTLRGIEHDDPDLPTVTVVRGQSLGVWVYNPSGDYPQAWVSGTNEDRATPSLTASTGTINFEEHAGAVVTITGDVEVVATGIPSGRAFAFAIKSSGARDVTFNSATTALADGDMLVGLVFSATVWNAKLLPAGDFE